MRSTGFKFKKFNNAIGDEIGQWSQIAKEGEEYTIDGKATVRYTSGWADDGSLRKTITGKFRCGNKFFGKDPAVGAPKVCEIDNFSKKSPEDLAAESAGSAPAAKSGLGVGAIIGISAGGLLILGTIGYFVFRSRKRAKAA